MAPGFPKELLRQRYDVHAFVEDQWHGYCGEQTTAIIQACMPPPPNSSSLLLNAGSGVYKLDVPGWTEIAVDLFEGPLEGRTNAVCASVESLPFEPRSFGAIVCVGEVLGYCDPQLAFKEFARLLVPGGTLICDFSSTLSPRHLMANPYGRAADIIVDNYNGTDERVWAYHPGFIKRLLSECGFRVRCDYGTHTWSSWARRVGLSPAISTAIQRRLGGIPLPVRWADLRSMVAERI